MLGKRGIALGGDGEQGYRISDVLLGNLLVTPVSILLTGRKVLIVYLGLFDVKKNHVRIPGIFPCPGSSSRATQFGDHLVVGYLASRTGATGVELASSEDRP